MGGLRRADVGRAVVPYRARANDVHDAIREHAVRPGPRVSACHLAAASDAGCRWGRSESRWRKAEAFAR